MAPIDSVVLELRVEDALTISSKYKSSHPPPFGHAMLNCFSLDPEYTNLNNGSYGTTPEPVQEACDKLEALSEWNPDLFMRVTQLSLLAKARAKVADFLKVKDVDEIFLVPNASHGVNTVLRNFIWEKEDTIVVCT
jgi:hercynylcysteine S-oxide lyase